MSLTAFDPEKVKTAAKKVFLVYLALSASLLGTIAAVWILKGSQGFRTIYQRGPLSDVPMTVFYAAAAWLLFGGVLVVLWKKDLTKDNGIVYAAFFLDAFLYLNALRERVVYGDYQDYIQAAVNLAAGEPIHQRYLYPPFWATLLQPFVPWGGEAMTALLKILNYVSLLLFFVLLYRVARRFGLAKTPSALAVFVLTAANMPILRTLGYVQVNIHTMNLILLCLLFSKKHVYFSALALSLAVHIKLTPVLLVLPFLLAKDWKWLKWFVVNMGGVVLLTSWMNDFGYYLDLYFLKNISTVLSSPGTIAYRDSSFESFFRATLLNLQANPEFGLILAAVTKIALIVLTAWLLAKTIKGRTFFQGEKRMEVIGNGFVVLTVVMTVLSPIVWEHHLVFLVFPFLVILKRLTTAADYFLCLSSYFAVFLLPTFDFYPFSYLRLLGVLLVFILFVKFSRREKSPPFVEKIA